MDWIDRISILCCFATVVVAVICRTRLKRYTRLRRLTVVMRDGSVISCTLMGEGHVVDGGILVLDAQQRPFVLRIDEVEDWRIEEDYDAGNAEDGV